MAKDIVTRLRDATYDYSRRDPMHLLLAEAANEIVALRANSHK
jgi:hypothetical protein